MKTISDREASFSKEISDLRAEVRALQRKIDAAARKKPSGGGRAIGHWVPGGPGRPPKDAEARVKAFAQRTGAEPKKKKTKKRKRK